MPHRRIFLPKGGEIRAVNCLSEALVCVSPFVYAVPELVMAFSDTLPSRCSHFSACHPRLARSVVVAERALYA